MADPREPNTIDVPDDDLSREPNTLDDPESDVVREPNTGIAREPNTRTE